MKDSLKNSELVKIIENLDLEKSEKTKIKSLIQDGKVQDAVYCLLPYINSEIKKQGSELEKVEAEYNSKNKDIEKELLENKNKFDEEFEKYYYEEFEKTSKDIENNEKQLDKAVEEIFRETKNNVEAKRKEYTEKVNSSMLNNVRNKINNLK
jgi:hypothetical protein